MAVRRWIYEKALGRIRAFKGFIEKIDLSIDGELDVSSLHFLVLLSQWVNFSAEDASDKVVDDADLVILV